jgi:hypothetical protein
VGEDPAWMAALAGGLAAGVLGSLVEDSGPVLLVVAVFALGCVTAYLWGRPRAPREQGAIILEPAPSSTREAPSAIRENPDPGSHVCTS